MIMIIIMIITMIMVMIVIMLMMMTMMIAWLPSDLCSSGWLASSRAVPGLPELHKSTTFGNGKRETWTV